MATSLSHTSDGGSEWFHPNNFQQSRFIIMMMVASFLSRFCSIYTLLQGVFVVVVAIIVTKSYKSGYLFALGFGTTKQLMKITTSRRRRNMTGGSGCCAREKRVTYPWFLFACFYLLC